MKARQWMLGVVGALTIVSAVLAGPQAASAEEEKPTSSGGTVRTYNFYEAWPTK